ncbi:MAG TPA: TSUP family transporter, partial [Novosphingobium sp.]|nr:TSUP family transporter [Novosphingobium sp.]
GVVLLLAAARLFWPDALKAREEVRDPPVLAGLAIGAGIGLLSGLTGTGGGIFLSPVLLFLGWSHPRTASGVVAAFILCNSAAGLAGNFASVQALPPALPLFVASVLAGAVVGTTAGIRFSSPAILKALGAVLVVAGLKLLGLF